MPQYYTSGEQLQQMRLDYGTRADGQPDYMGYSDKDALTTEGKWIIYKFTYTADPGNMTRRQVVVGIWDNRASLF